LASRDLHPLARRELPAAPPCRRGPGPRPTTSFEYNRRQIPSSNIPASSVSDNLVSVEPRSVSMGSSDDMKELLEELSAKIDDMKESLNKLAPLAPVADQLTSVPAKVVTLQSVMFENSEQIRARSISPSSAQRRRNMMARDWRSRKPLTPTTPPSRPRRGPGPYRRPIPSRSRSPKIDSGYRRISPGARTRRRKTSPIADSTLASTWNSPHSTGRKIPCLG
jgi:hypothetical protein